MLAVNTDAVAWRPFLPSLLLAASGQLAACLARNQRETRTGAEVICRVEFQSTISFMVPWARSSGRDGSTSQREDCYSPPLDRGSGKFLTHERRHHREDSCPVFSPPSPFGPMTVSS